VAMHDLHRALAAENRGFFIEKSDIEETLTS
jgi:hypothetical protein